MRNSLFIAILLRSLTRASAQPPPISPDSSVAPFAKGDCVAFLGDSITCGGQYHKFIFTYGLPAIQG